uniref:CUB domain-containing protein n=1 Tax=Panagrolaimus davidi TaxID=227884 RepID=A0A914QHD8_9BILA
MAAFWDAVVLSFSPSSASECPFSEQIVMLDNETIIPISSDFGVPEIFTNPICNWKFKNIDPENFQFKVYIKQLIYPYTLLLSNIYYDGNVTLDDPQVRYFNGSDLTIMSINANNDKKVSNGFFAIISLVPIKAKYIEECQIQANVDGTIAISNMNYENGYKPFSTCSYNISIPTGHEAILLISQHFLEAGVDKLTVSKENESYELRNNEYYRIQKEFNGSIFKFIADGNTQQAGFSAVYRTIVLIDAACRHY